MANENDIKFRLQTEGDTSGADAVEESMVDAKDAAKDLGAASSSMAAATAAAGKQAAAAAKAVAQSHAEIAKSMSTQELEDYVATMAQLTEAEREQWMQSKQVIAVQNELETRRNAARQQLDEETAAIVKQQDALKEKIRLEEQHIQRLEDVEEAKRRVAARDKEAAAAGKSQGTGPELLPAGSTASATAAAAGVAAMAGAAKLGSDAVMEVLYRYRELRKEMTQSEAQMGAWTDSMIEVMEWITSPLDKLKGAMVSLAGLDELEKSLEWGREMEDLYKKTKAAHDAYAKSVADDATNRALRNQLASINEQTAAMDRQLSTLRARRELLEAKAQVADKAALASGEDPAVVAINEIVRQQVARVDEVSDAVTRAEAAKDAADGRLTAAVNKLKNLQHSGGTDQEIREATTAMEEMDRGVKEAAKDLATARENAGIEIEKSQVEASQAIREVKAKATEGFKEATTEQSRALAELAKEAIEPVKKNIKEIEDAGGQVKGVQKQMVSVISKMIEDGAITGEELAPVRASLEVLSRSVDKSNDTVVEGLTKAAAAFTATDQKIRELINQFNQVMQRMNAMTPDFR
ncbi:hypothetical protein OVA24_16790 [Luteolibacter sp. SL250]|uniref:hypothetical protein n=1 Tax=Luteolibacter sp. SL250 TaxID=2995170 RepID=UPI00226F7436|nr:hypothetical protein [Luteolibacter sp. SL250]WAC18890.1 hypothetical protein OVA24_16790 [Luteolibacter sp. SL250]